MTIGAGKYDEQLTIAREACGSTAAMLIVVNGNRGPGFACQSDLVSMARLPAMLRFMADQIEADLKKGKL